jgi:hypothetical protein
MQRAALFLLATLSWQPLFAKTPAQVNDQPAEAQLIEHGSFQQGRQHRTPPAHSKSGQTPRGATIKCRDGSYSFNNTIAVPAPAMARVSMVKLAIGQATQRLPAHRLASSDIIKSADKTVPQRCAALARLHFKAVCIARQAPTARPRHHLRFNAHCAGWT